MYLVLIAWLYVAVMMAVAEATNSNGTVLGAIITFLFYGVLPMSLVLYLMGTPARKRAIRAREAQERAQWEAEQAARTPKDGSGGEPDASSHAPGGAQPPGISPVGKEPH